MKEPLATWLIVAAIIVLTIVAFVALYLQALSTIEAAT